MSSNCDLFSSKPATSTCEKPSLVAELPEARFWIKISVSEAIMIYVKISPEVAGSFGENTEMDTSVHPPAVSHIHHQFQGWLGDDVLEVFPCFLVTARLAKALATSQLTGIALAEAEVSASDEFEALQPETELPELQWLQITASFPDEADFRLAHDHRLEVSERALALLQRFEIDHATVEPAG